MWRNNQIYVHHFNSNQWFTSGRRSADDPLKFYWAGDGETIESFQYWLDDTERGVEGLDIIVYKFQGRCHLYRTLELFM